MSERRWLTISQAAEYFSLKPKTLYSLAARNRLPAGAVLRIGRALRFDIKAIEVGVAMKRGYGGKAHD